MINLKRLLYFSAGDISMSPQSKLQIWDLWYPQAAATGIEATNVLWVHAPPKILTVEVRGESGNRLAFAEDLSQTADRPMARLTRQGESITREDVWPTESALGQLVILPGGEVGHLLSWWNAEDGNEWRWQVEFYNHR
jgi:hypothetical protein